MLIYIICQKGIIIRRSAFRKAPYRQLFWAMKQFVDLQDSYDSYIFIADYHALHSLRKHEGNE